MKPGGGGIDDGRVAVVAAERAVGRPVDDVERVRPGTIGVRVGQRDRLRQRVVGPDELIGNDGSRVPSHAVGMPSFDGDGVERPARERRLVHAIREEPHRVERDGRLERDLRFDALAIDVDVVREAGDIDAHADRRLPGERHQRRRGPGPAIAERLIHAADAPPYEIDANSSRRRAGVHLRAVAELHVHGVSVVGASLGPVELELPLQESRGNFVEAVRYERPHHDV